MTDQADPRTAQLATAFAETLKSWLSLGELAEVRRRNLLPEYAANGSCATHDFCDANMAMVGAFEDAFGSEPDIWDREDGQEGPDLALFNAAWAEGVRQATIQKGGARR